MKVYDIVKDILIKYPATRSSDKKLIWVVWGTLGYLEGTSMPREKFFDSPSLESITRARRKIQELNPDLSANKLVKESRARIEDQKGTHIYRETVQTREELVSDIVSM